MANNTAGVTNQDSNSAIAEEYLDRKLLEDREYDTPLAQSPFASIKKLPKFAGQHVQFTRRNRIRKPAKLAEGTDPSSGAQLSVNQIHVPLEFIKDYVEIPKETADMSWLDLMQFAYDEVKIAVRREIHQLVQDTFVVGRMTPGVYDSSGNITTTFRATAEASPTLYGSSFTFDPAPTYYVDGVTNYSDLTTGSKHRMADYKQVATRLRNSGAPRINNRYIAVISQAVCMDLMEDDKYFQMAIRSDDGKKKLMEGFLCDYAGIHWVLQDDPFAENLTGTENAFVEGGNVHTSHVFGKDAFAYIRHGGKDSLSFKFKVQDISKTGTVVTVGFNIPFQSAILNTEWCANVKGPVSTPQVNNGNA